MKEIFPYLFLPLISLGGMGLAFGVILAYAARKFKVEVDQREAQIREVLPGANCGACGYPGCDAFASAVNQGKAPVDGCKAGGPTVAEKLGQILGVQIDHEGKKKVAFVKCGGTIEKAVEKYHYEGLSDCRVAAMYQEGMKGCRYGCLGLGTCEKECPFDAIHVGEGGVAVVDEEKCTGCGICVDVCPKKIIDLVYSSRVRVACFSLDKGKDVRLVCQAGCIGCRACERVCPHDAIHVKENLAAIDYDKCTNCGLCVEKCPVKCIKVIDVNHLNAVELEV
ncbi:electron transport complex, RnfABCDGE type, B subunit [Caldanaerobius fijiensis DSM 17918]|uniref:Ion-translocating oxidoreductase complex subunit B n=1 Tax=Caldanaerobius fijiensis DSM 17918 TaxID=1121256 RepID=A0A1M4V088_9THEO|nr:RnfABCDGE type electron transport complex subunit B [Caldanaerobius fijiensis]SHE62329.1 electron transport complex, RnfABCDGE type, B subunit [Caldanaerobius fijiensis DSM 17918]